MRSKVWTMVLAFAVMATLGLAAGIAIGRHIERGEAARRAEEKSEGRAAASTNQAIDVAQFVLCDRSPCRLISPTQGGSTVVAYQQGLVIVMMELYLPPRDSK